MTVTEIEKPNKLKLFREEDYKKSNGMTQAEYADHRDITRQAVFKHKHAGRLVLLDNGNIDVEASDVSLDADLDPAFTGNADEQRGVKKGNVADGQGGIDTSLEPETFSDRKLYRLNIQIQRDEIELEKEHDNVVDKRRIEKAYGSKISAVITRLQKIPKRIAPSLAKQTNREECEEMVKTEIKDAVEEFI